jgi:hypothetical protein
MLFKLYNYYNIWILFIYLFGWLFLIKIKLLSIISSKKIFEKYMKNKLN